MKSNELRKKITTLCQIKSIHVSGCELRSYNNRELKIIYNNLISISSITKKTNSMYKTTTIY